MNGTEDRKRSPSAGVLLAHARGDGLGLRGTGQEAVRRVGRGSQLKGVIHEIAIREKLNVTPGALLSGKETNLTRSANAKTVDLVTTRNGRVVGRLPGQGLHQRHMLGADLVVEVVSPDDPARDLVDKRTDYAEAGIPEYWIVDPRDETIRVLTLRGGAYAEHGVYARGGSAPSPLLTGFAAAVSAVFDAPAAGA